MLALARKYRPRTFADVAVQSHVSTTLKGAIAAGRVAHGYLLSGPRGVGKTTLARVLAMALNCEQGAPGGEPCGVCTSCQRIWTGSTSLDVVEIDAATNRGVDDARELRERAMYAPSGEDRYKVYIVDEAHMLTREAWNALLKVLEEPPPRVVFVFATTEPHKIAQSAAPVLSRLQRFDFKRIGPAEIRQRLITVLGAEQVAAEPEALAMIARAADGSMRDALSLTDQVMALGTGTITAARAREALGLIPEDEYIGLLDIIADRRAQDVFPLVGRLADSGIDFGQFLGGLGDILRAQLAVALGGDAPDVSETARAALRQRKDRLEAADLLRMLNAIAEIEIRFRRSGQQQLLIETMLVRFALLDRTVALEDVLRAIGSGEGGGNGGGGGGGRQASRAAPSDAPGGPGRGGAPGSMRGAPAVASRPVEMQAAGASGPPPLPRTESQLAREVVAGRARPAADINAITGRWDALVSRMQASGKALLGAALAASNPQALTRDGDLIIALDEPNDFHAKAIEQARAEIAGALREWFDGIGDVRLLRPETAQPVPDRPARMTDEMVKQQRLASLRKKSPALDAAVDVLDLDLAD